MPLTPETSYDYYSNPGNLHVFKILNLSWNSSLLFASGRGLHSWAHIFDTEAEDLIFMVTAKLIHPIDWAVCCSRQFASANRCEIKSFFRIM